MQCTKQSNDASRAVHPKLGAGKSLRELKPWLHVAIVPLQESLTTAIGD